MISCELVSFLVHVQRSDGHGKHVHAREAAHRSDGKSDVASPIRL